MNRIKELALMVLKFFFESKPRFVLFLLLLVIPAIMLVKLIEGSHPSSFTVMVTRMDELSGGSGSVIYASRDKSIVLTNAHVCDVLNKAGGVVKKENGTRYMISGYRKSEFHDLCAVYVAADLGGTVKLAEKAPDSYSEAIITGHPALLPNIINKGSFGERKIIDIMIGMRACTEENVKSEEDAIICSLVGGLPIIKSFESVVVSAMIMAGSSGSAVLNSNGELSGVVFAGQGQGLSYAFIVPFEYVSLFLREEMNIPKEITKVPLETEKNNKHEEVMEIKKKLINECRKENKKIKRMCTIVSKDLE